MRLGFVATADGCSAGAPAPGWSPPPPKSTERASERASERALRRNAAKRALAAKRRLGPGRVAVARTSFFSIFVVDAFGARVRLLGSGGRKARRRAGGFALWWASMDAAGWRRFCAALSAWRGLREHRDRGCYR